MRAALINRPEAGAIFHCGPKRVREIEDARDLARVVGRSRIRQRGGWSSMRTRPSRGIGGTRKPRHGCMAATVGRVRRDTGLSVSRFGDSCRAIVVKPRWPVFAMMTVFEVFDRAELKYTTVGHLHEKVTVVTMRRS